MPASVDYHEYLIKSLKNRKEALGYLNACLEDPDPRVFASALRDVAIALGGLKKDEKLIDFVSKRGTLDFRRVCSLLARLGLRLAVQKNNAGVIPASTHKA
jgi:DNA-binding phage protein